MKTNLSQEERAKIAQIVALGLLIPDVKISINTEVKCINVFDFPPSPENETEEEERERDYIYNYQSYFADGTYKLDEVITLLSKHIADNGIDN